MTDRPPPPAADGTAPVRVFNRSDRVWVFGFVRMLPLDIHTDNAIELTIRNCRPIWLTGPLVLFGLGCMWTVWLGVRTSGILDRVFPPEVDLCSLGTVTSVALLLAYWYQPVRHWKLGEVLVVWPERRYQPADIRAIEFAPDPAEDYDEEIAPARLCEARARLRRRDVRLIVRLEDARRLREWAERNGIAVLDPHGCSRLRSGDGAG